MPEVYDAGITSAAAAGNILQQDCNGLRRNAQFREREHLLAEVFQQIFFQHFVRPLAELRASDGLNSFSLNILFVCRLTFCFDV